MLGQAYRLGAAQAEEDFTKEAIFGAVRGLWNATKAFPKSTGFKALKWGAGMGGPGAEWIGAPIGSGILGAATANEGERWKGFLGGAAGGLAGAAGWHAGKGVAKGVGNSIGRSLGKTKPGAAFANLGGADSKFRDYLNAKAKSFAGADASGFFKGKANAFANSDKSIGQMVGGLAPKAMGLAGGLGGSMMLYGVGQSGGEYGAQHLGLGGRPVNYFNPVGGF